MTTYYDEPSTPTSLSQVRKFPNNGDELDAGDINNVVEDLMSRDQYHEYIIGSPYDLTYSLQSIARNLIKYDARWDKISGTEILHPIGINGSGYTSPDIYWAMIPNDNAYIQNIKAVPGSVDNGRLVIDVDLSNYTNAYIEKVVVYASNVCQSANKAALRLCEFDFSTGETTTWGPQSDIWGSTTYHPITLTLSSGNRLRVERLSRHCIQVSPGWGAAHTTGMKFWGGYIQLTNQG